MENKCPKCGAKLSLFYLKTVCPECKCDLMYYDMEKRLEEDAKKAEAEFQWLENFLTKLKNIFKFKKKKSAKEKQV